MFVAELAKASEQQDAMTPHSSRSASGKCASCFARVRALMLLSLVTGD